MDCCSVNDLDKEFNQAWARKELKGYRKKGLAKRARKLADLLAQQGLTGGTLLEVGGGIGALHQELLRRGATSAIGVDASHAYIEAAEELADELGSRDRVEYQAGNFIDLEANLPEADIVLLDRVVCCYPDMKSLVSASARHAARLYALTYPRRNWPVRGGMLMFNLLYILFRRRFRIFAHKPSEVSATLEAQGFRRIVRSTHTVWELAVYAR